MASAKRSPESRPTLNLKENSKLRLLTSCLHGQTPAIAASTSSRFCFRAEALSATRTETSAKRATSESPVACQKADLVRSFHCIHPDKPLSFREAWFMVSVNAPTQ